MKYKARILNPKNTYTWDYPEALEFELSQRKVLWLPEEFDVEKDIQDLLINMSPAEAHGVKTVLKLFTKYELVVGNEYWGGKFKRIYKRPDLERMASCFSYVELNIHAPFYSLVDEALMLKTDEHYNSYVNDPELVARMEFLDNIVSDKNPLMSVGGFSMIEGAILYSNFAFLKHFNVCGKNLIRNVVAGINMSVADENYHAQAGAWIYRTTKKEMIESGDITIAESRVIEDKLIEAAKTIYEHESRIIDMIFENGKIKGITEHQMKNFVKSRLDICLNNLGIGAIYKPDYNPIADWFYSNINSYNFHDFFNSSGREYHRDWSESKFVWSVKNEQ
jgi:ribonucleotide reductase beta subunit family protein with ferritin-like domain